MKDPTTVALKFSFLFDHQWANFAAEATNGKTCSRSLIDLIMALFPPDQLHFKNNLKGKNWKKCFREIKTRFFNLRKNLTRKFQIKLKFCQSKKRNYLIFTSDESFFNWLNSFWQRAIKQVRKNISSNYFIHCSPAKWTCWNVVAIKIFFSYNQLPKQYLVC